VSLVVRPAAAADLDEAFLWYEAQRDGLGEEFLNAVTRIMSGLAESPRQYPVVYRDTRRALVRRFPYSVFYRVLESDVVVVACFHGSRDPETWRGRR
jgi:plasmid stabilization system protein ParE